MHLPCESDWFGHHMRFCLDPCLFKFEEILNNLLDQLFNVTLSSEKCPNFCSMRKTHLDISMGFYYQASMRKNEGIRKLQNFPLIYSQTYVVVLVLGRSLIATLSFCTLSCLLQTFSDTRIRCVGYKLLLHSFNVL